MLAENWGLRAECCQGVPREGEGGVRWYLSRRARSMSTIGLALLALGEDVALFKAVRVLKAWQNNLRQDCTVVNNIKKVLLTVTSLLPLPPTEAEAEAEAEVAAVNDGHHK